MYFQDESARLTRIAVGQWISQAQIKAVLFYYCTYYLLLINRMQRPYRELLDGNWYGPAFLQPDWLIASPYNMIRTSFFNFCRKSFLLKFLLFWHRKFSKLDKIFILCSLRKLIIPNKWFVNIRITYRTMCRSCKKVVFYSKMMMPLINDLLTGLLGPY